MHNNLIFVKPIDLIDASVYYFNHSIIIAISDLYDPHHLLTNMRAAVAKNEVVGVRLEAFTAVAKRDPKVKLVLNFK